PPADRAREAGVQRFCNLNLVWCLACSLRRGGLDFTFAPVHAACERDTRPALDRRPVKFVSPAFSCINVEREFAQKHCQSRPMSRLQAPSQKLINNDIAPLPFPLPALLKQ